MFLSERQEQSQHLADQLGVPLPPLVLGAANTPAGKRLCQEEGVGAPTNSLASTLDSSSSANTMTAEVRSWSGLQVKESFSSLGNVEVYYESHCIYFLSFYT